MSDQPATQAVVTEQSTLIPNQAVEKLALFNADGSPYSPSVQPESANFACYVESGMTHTTVNTTGKQTLINGIALSTWWGGSHPPVTPSWIEFFGDEIEGSGGLLNDGMFRITEPGVYHVSMSVYHAWTAGSGNWPGTAGWNWGLYTADGSNVPVVAPKLDSFPPAESGKFFNSNAQVFKDRWNDVVVFDDGPYGDQAGFKTWPVGTLMIGFGYISPMKLSSGGIQAAAFLPTVNDINIEVVIHRLFDKIPMLL